MEKFIKRNIAFFTILLVPFLLVIAVLYKYIPAPRITNSYSLNEKMKFVAKRPVASPEIVSIGSSIAFNNLSSKVITDAFHTHSYLNMASWGLRIKDTYEILTDSYDVLRPKKIIIASSAVDFNGPTIAYNIKDFRDYVENGNLLYYQMKFFNPKYFFKRLITNSWYYSSDDVYKSLKFDNYGAVLLSPDSLEVIETRWEQEVVFDYVSPDSYLYLDSLASFLRTKNTELIFIQSPIRKEVRTEVYFSKVNKHMKKVDSIISQYDHCFINCTKIPLEDSLFADSQHFNSMGANVFTAYWVNEYFNGKNHVSYLRGKDLPTVTSE